MPTSGRDSPLRLVVFDVDGTLIDSRRGILSAMRAAFAAAGRPAPPEAEILSIVGLSLPVALARLAPGGPVNALVAAYLEAFLAMRAAGAGEGASPLFPGARAALERLDAAGLLLAVATGKARRGLLHALEAHDLERFFLATQSADDAPSKPHPGMVLNALRLTGVDAADAIMVGDTTFDVEMARAAGARAVGVSWGHHAPEALMAAGAAAVIDGFEALDAALDALWEPA
mgnify:CR=1 FL=1